MWPDNEAERDFLKFTGVAEGTKRLVIVGATGMVGGYALRVPLDNSAVKSAVSIGRKGLGISNSELKEVLHQNFADCSPLADALFRQDAVVYCLGSARNGEWSTSLRCFDRDDLQCDAVVDSSQVYGS